MKFAVPLSTRSSHSLGTLAIATWLALSIIGCSRDTTIFEEKTPETVLPISTDGRVLLPKNFYDQSVGRAQVETQLDGVTSASKAIRFQTQGGATSAGAYNGTGTGNRALLGLGSWHGRPLGTLTDMRWEAKSDFGTLQAGVILQIDLKCDGSSIVVAEARPAALPAPIAKADAYVEYRALLTDTVWISLKAPLLHPTTSAELLSTNTGSPRSLSDVYAAYPAACLKNGATGAAALPKSIPTAAILWSLGDDANTASASLFIRRFQVGSEEYKDLE